MTIPIKPGPFSFIGGAGEAVGAAYRAKEQKRIEDLTEARQSASMLLQFRQLGYLNGADFANSAVQDIFNRAGIPAPSTDLTPDEQKAKLTGDYIKAAGQPATPVSIPIGSLGLPGVDTSINVPATAKFTPEQRALIGAPQPSELAGERVKQGIAGQQQLALGAGGASARAVAGVKSPQVATADESVPVAEAFTREAPGFVALAVQGADLRNVSRGTYDSYVNAAYQAYLQDAQAHNQAVLPEDQAKRYFAQALDEKIRQSQALDVQRLAAGARFAATDKELPDIDRDIDNKRLQQNNARQRLQNLVSQLPPGLPVQMIRDNPTLSMLWGDLISQIDNEHATIDRLETEIVDAQNRYHKALGARYPERAPGPDLSEKQQLWDGMLEEMRRGAQFAGNPRKPNETPDQYARRVLGPRP